MKFSDLGLGEDLLRAVTDAGYDTPTPIQAQAIPYVLMNRDLLGCARVPGGEPLADLFLISLFQLLRRPAKLSKLFSCKA